MEPKEYQYSKSITENELRLLTVKCNANFKSQIECELWTGPREKCPTYTALSYRWGYKGGTDVNVIDMETRQDILIDGLLYGVNIGVFSALKWLRLDNEDRVLWIDQVCINQSDKEERKLQMRKMAQTYGSSHKVVVWLGVPDSEHVSTVGIKAIDILGLQLDDVELRYIPTTAIAPPSTILGPSGKEYGIAQYGHAVVKLLTRPWFTRRWVVQEISLAPEDTILVCGHDEVAFWKLTQLQLHPFMLQLLFTYQRSAPKEGEEEKKESPYLMLAGTQEPPIGMTRQWFVAERAGKRKPIAKSCTLQSHLHNFRNRECTDPRDRIYALLGISRDIQGIQADYDMQIADAYAIATRKIIKTHGKLDILGMCQGPDDTPPTAPSEEAEEPVAQKAFPSWVPNFDLGPSMRPLNSFTVYSTNAPYYQATQKSLAYQDGTENLSEIVLDGYLIDEIEDLGYDGSTVNFHENLKRSHRIAHDQARKASRTYDEIEDAFWRTLITNRTADNGLARPEIEGVQYKLWWNQQVGDRAQQKKETGVNFVKFNSAIINHFMGRNFFTTKQGGMGVCSLAAKSGDCIFLLAGAQVPSVLRKAEGSPQSKKEDLKPQKADLENYRMIGECYVHNVMNGSLWEKLETTAPKTRHKLRLV